MRCSLCGSKQVSLISNSSYSMKKGIVGAAVFGPIGAVAGINGNQSTVYHCMECGQDSFKALDNYFEQLIDNALSEGDQETLNRYRSSWRNIGYPADSIKTRQKNVNKVVVKEDSGIELLSSNELKIVIKEFISSSAVPYDYDELTQKYIKNNNVKEAIDLLLTTGNAHMVYLNDKAYVVPAKSLEEIQLFAQIEAAGTHARKDIKPGVFRDIIGILQRNGSISITDLEEQFAVIHSELVWENNPYSISRLVEELVYLLVCDKQVINSDDGKICLSNIIEREKILRAKAGKLSGIAKVWAKNICDSLRSHENEKLTILEIVDLFNKHMGGNFDIYSIGAERLLAGLMLMEERGLIVNEVNGDISTWMFVDVNTEKRENPKLRKRAKNSIEEEIEEDKKKIKTIGKQKNLIYQYLKDHPNSSVLDIARNNPELSKLSNQKLAGLLIALKSEGLVIQNKHLYRCK